MFCENCDNLMDITNNINIETDNLENNQEGGKLKKEPLLDNNFDAETESSDYDISTTIGGNSGENEDETDIPNIKELSKDSKFNKLSNERKTLLINQIIDKNQKLEITKKNTKNTNIAGKESYYKCLSCGYYKKIPPKQLIFSHGQNSSNWIYNTHNYKYDNVLPSSKKYTCLNEKCNTHKNPEIKMAKFLRYGNTYATMYICSICNTSWNTFTEK